MNYFLDFRLLLLKRAYSCDVPITHVDSMDPPTLLSMGTQTHWFTSVTLLS